MTEICLNRPSSQCLKVSKNSRMAWYIKSQCHGRKVRRPIVALALQHAMSHDSRYKCPCLHAGAPWLVHEFPLKSESTSSDQGQLMPEVGRHELHHGQKPEYTSSGADANRVKSACGKRTSSVRNHENLKSARKNTSSRGSEQSSTHKPENTSCNGDEEIRSDRAEHDTYSKELCRSWSFSQQSLCSRHRNWWGELTHLSLYIQ